MVGACFCVAAVKLGVHPLHSLRESFLNFLPQPNILTPTTHPTIIKVLAELVRDVRGDIITEHSSFSRSDLRSSSMKMAFLHRE